MDKLPCWNVSITPNTIYLTAESSQRWLVYCSTPGSVSDLQLSLAAQYRHSLQRRIYEWSFRPGMTASVREMRQMARKLAPHRMRKLSGFAADTLLAEALDLSLKYGQSDLEEEYQTALGKLPRFLRLAFPQNTPPPAESGEKSVAGSE